MKARGLNLEGMAVAGDVDARWPDGSIAEASSQKDYFTAPYAKAQDDIRHALKAEPNVKKLRLFCSRVAPAGREEDLRRAVEERHGNGFELDVWDGERICKYIVDVLLRDQRYVERVGSTLPNLRRIAEQHAATGLVPPQSPMYGGRCSEEAALLRQLETSKCVVLWGTSGIGKTELAVAVAGALRRRFEMVMWVTATDIRTVMDLRSIDVRNNGHTLNVWGMLNDASILLVLDDVTVDLDVGSLAARCGSSRVIVTSQAEFPAGSLDVGFQKVRFVDRSQAERILSSGLDLPCPEQIVDRAVDVFDGHPLLLRLLNRRAADDGGWEEVEGELGHLLSSTTQNRETAAKRLLARHLSAVGPELAFFLWCGQRSVDSGLFRCLFAKDGKHKLDVRAMTVAGQDDVVQVHQFVLLAAERLREEGMLQVLAERFQSDLERYLAATGHRKALPFYRVVHRHRDLIARLLQVNPRPGVLRYAYFHGCRVTELRPSLVGKPEEDLGLVLDGGCERMDVLSLTEAIERDYLCSRERDRDAAKAALEGRLGLYSELEHGTGDRTIRDVVRHHHAKSLLKLGRRKEALSAFRALNDSAEVRFQARLQVARLSRDDPKGAFEQIKSIVAAERQRPGTVATSVLLEAFVALRLGFLRGHVEVFEREIRNYMARQIKAAACSGETHPMQAFAAVGVGWAFVDEELFMDVLEVIEVGRPEDAEDDNGRVATGRVLTAAGKKHLREDRKSAAYRRLKEAVGFYRAVARPGPFGMVHYADALIRLERYAEARKLLDEVEVDERKPYWQLRRAEVHRAHGEFAEALERLDVALQDDHLGGPRATFLELRGEVLFDMHDPGFREWFGLAIACSDGAESIKNRERLSARLDALEGEADGW